MTATEEFDQGRALRGKKMEIKINSVHNGWTISPAEKSYINVSEMKVARSPKELCGLIEEWANAEGKTEEKKVR